MPPGRFLTTSMGSTLHHDFSSCCFGSDAAAPSKPVPAMIPAMILISVYNGHTGSQLVPERWVGYVLGWVCRRLLDVIQKIRFVDASDIGTVTIPSNHNLGTS